MNRSLKDIVEVHFKKRELVHADLEISVFMVM